jgi:uncharacterized protein (TIGR03435 family)
MKCTLALLLLGLVSTFSPAQSPTSRAQSPTSPAQSPGAAPLATATSPEFEAATIKPVKEPDPNRMNDRTDGRRYTTRNTTLRDLILMAYGVDRQQIAGGPTWIATDEYDVDAVAGEDVHFENDLQTMLQKLLADRFKLTFHREQREQSIYALMVAKGGPKLKAADANEKQGSGCTRLGECAFKRDTLQHFARWMGFAVLDKPVQDKTGLAGEFDFELKWTPDETQFAGMGIHVPPPVDNSNAPPGLFTAIEEQLGLRLEPQKIPSEVLVIDHAERPTEN